MKKVIERRIVIQDWYEINENKNGWDSHGWMFDNGECVDTGWTIVEHVHVDKFGNPFLAIAERVVEV